MTDIDAIPEPWPEVAATAARLGLLLEVRPQPDGMIHALVSHPAAHPTDWSLAPTKIAFGRSPLIVASSAIAALREMAPRLQRKLDELDPAHEGLAIAAGVGSDGTVTALRVERDGTVRISPEDIAAIVNGVMVADLKVAELTDWQTAARKVLGSLRWPFAESASDIVCPICDQPNYYHKADCALEALL